MLARELQDPLAEVCLDRLDLARLEMIVKPDLLGCHRLALDRQLDLALGCQVADDLTGVLRRTCEVNDRANRFSLLRELLDQLRQAGYRVRFATVHIGSHRLEIEVSKRDRASITKCRERPVERGGEIRVVDCGVEPPLKISTSGRHLISSTSSWA